MFCRQCRPWNGVCSVLYIYCHAVTDSSAERSFSKLKLRKSYLRSSSAQDRLDSFALISIENEAARQLDLNELVNKFANIKARKKDL
jgi:hAT family C-terminal dimerisation region